MINSIDFPLLSVIIPTHNRPVSLPRAVKSALGAAPNGDIEVIVVPNGGDTSWQQSLFEYLNHKQIVISPIAEGHANVARNHGLSIAKGKYVRFLDDDDYLFVEGATKQLEMIQKMNVDICGGAVAVVNSEEKIMNVLSIENKNDFIANVLSSAGRTGIQFYLYRREAIKNLIWDESVDIGQDTQWTHQMCRNKDWTWCVIDDVVCAWVQHSPNQISQKFGPSKHLILQKNYKWKTLQELIKNNRMNDLRYIIASEGLWSLIHAGFFLKPWYWYPVIKETQKLFPNTYPNIPIYKTKFKGLIPVILLELIMLPKRWLNYYHRNKLIKSGKKSGWE